MVLDNAECMLERDRSVQFPMVSEEILKQGMEEDQDMVNEGYQNEGPS